MFILASISDAKIDGLSGHVLRIGTCKASQKHACHGKSPGLNMSHPHAQDDPLALRCGFSPFLPSLLLTI